MKSRIRTVVENLVALLVAGLVIWLLFLVGRATVRTFRQLEPEILASIIAAASAVVVSVVSVTGARLLESRQLIGQDLRAKKVPVYQDFINGIFRIFDLGRTGSSTETVALEVFADLTPRLLIWASDDVLRQWSTFRRSSGSLKPEETLLLMGELFAAIRRDLGHKNKKVDHKELLGLFVNDIEQLDGLTEGR